MNGFISSKYASLVAYTPGEQPQDMKYVKLNTNESPYPPSPEVTAAVSAETVSRLRLYSDPECRRLRAALAAQYVVRPENVFVSNGSDDILNFAFMVFGEHGAVFPDISYGFYTVFADLHGVKYDLKPLRADFTVDTADYLTGGAMVVLANPNAPTGIALGVSEIERIAAANPDRVVVIDEAYVDFGAESCVPLTKKYPNLLVCMTFSKSRSLAGARLGFAIGGKALMDGLNLIKYSTNPYNVNSMTLAAGEAAVASQGYFDAMCRKIAETRENTAARLIENGFEVLPSKANFLFARSPDIGGGELYSELRKRGVLVRHFTAERIKDYNRISIGTPEDMDRLISEIKDISGGVRA